MEMTKMERPMNVTMLMDFYELTMSNGYFEHNLKDKVVCFDMFFRKIPDGGGDRGGPAGVRAGGQHDCGHRRRYVRGGHHLACRHSPFTQRPFGR